MCLLEHLAPCLPRSLTDELDPEARASVPVRSEGAVKVVEGKHSSCFQAEKDTDGAYSLHSAVQAAGYKWGAAHLIGTQTCSKASPQHGFYPCSIRDLLIGETNPLNQVGLSCKAWLVSLLVSWAVEPNL